jgi:hypothetical protein
MNFKMNKIEVVGQLFPEESFGRLLEFRILSSWQMFTLDI